MDNENVILPAAGENPSAEGGRPLIEKYLPWVRHADAVISTLLDLGLSRRQVTAALSGEEVTVIGELVNPEDRRPLLVPSAVVSLKVTDGGMTCTVLIDGKGVATFFHEYYEREAYLRRAGSQSEVVGELYEEVLSMRRLLGGKARAYK